MAIDVNSVKATPKSFLKRAVEFVGLGRQLSLYQFLHTQYSEQVERSSWHRQIASDSTNIDPTFEVRGSGYPYDWLRIGKHCTVEKEVTVWRNPLEGSSGTLHLGERSFIGRNSYIGVHESISVGQNTMIGAYAYITSGNHAFSRLDVPMRDQGFTSAPVRIDADVWIGTHVVVLPGVAIGEGAIVGAGAVVTGIVPPYEIWGGIPARRIGSRAAAAEALGQAGQGNS